MGAICDHKTLGQRMNFGPSAGVSAYRLLAGAVGAMGLVLKLWAMLAPATAAEALTTTVTYFSYFTILSNLLVLGALVLPEVAPHSAMARLFCRYDLRTATAVYMIVTGIIYALFLSGAAGETRLSLLADVTLHYVMPPLYVVDWIRLRPLTSIAWKYAGYFLVFPILFGVYTLARGAATGVYPYPFFDVGHLGYPAVLVNCCRLLLLCLVVSVLIIALGRWRRAPADASKP
jgi:hypothetical protein